MTSMFRWIHGRPGGAGIFLLSQEIAGIGHGEAVLIIAEATDNELAYVPGACVPLQLISEEDAQGN